MNSGWSGAVNPVTALCPGLVDTANGVPDTLLPSSPVTADVVVAAFFLLQPTVSISAAFPDEDTDWWLRLPIAPSDIGCTKDGGRESMVLPGETAGGCAYTPPSFPPEVDARAVRVVGSVAVVPAVEPEGRKDCTTVPTAGLTVVAIGN